MSMKTNTKKSMKKNSNTELNNKKGNAELRVTMVFFSLLFVGMITYLCIYTTTNKKDLFNNSYNSRQAQMALINKRGVIEDRNGNILAQTVLTENGETRVYPYGNLFSHVVGYSTKGKTGIEELANYDLMNSNIPMSEKIENEINGRKNPGNTVITTLDADIQQVTYDAIGAYKGAAIVTNVKTGEILAMVSKPDFDPNSVAIDWDKHLEDEESGVLLNRVTQGIYPPGSTFKMLTTLEYAKEHDNQMEDYHFSCHGRFTYANTTIQCYHGSVHGEEDFKTSFAKSCNTSFANIGVNLDRNEFGNTLDALMFNSELPIPLPYKQSELYLDDSISNDDMIQVAIGQGKAQITPAHLNLITCAIANDGKLMTPMLIKEVETYNGVDISKNNAKLYKQLLTKEESDILTDYMIEVVNSGTAKKLQSEYYQAAGKTGSAEFAQNHEDSHAWFTGFAPAEDPEIAVTIIIESIGSGGDYAVPIARRIFDACLK